MQVPYGAYPSSCYKHYDYDPAQLSDFAKAAKDDGAFKAYLDRFVYGVKDHQGLLDLVGKDRLAKIKADPRTGYATGLDRK